MPRGGQSSCEAHAREENYISPSRYDSQFESTRLFKKEWPDSIVIFQKGRVLHKIIVKGFFYAFISI